MRADKRQLNEHGIRLGWSSLRDFAITLCVAPLDGSSTYLLLCLLPSWSPPFQTAHQVPMPLALRLFLIRDRLPPPPLNTLDALVISIPPRPSWLEILTPKLSLTSPSRE